MNLVSSLRAVLRVSSIRVPRCSLMVTLNRPLSCSCMKSVPILPWNTGSNDAANRASRISNVIALWRKHQPRALAYASSTTSSTRTTVRSYSDFLPASSSIRLPFSSTCTCLAFSNFEQSIGVSVIATTVDVQHTTVTIHPNSWNIIPAIPLSIVSGTNTATSTSVVAITDTHTSFVA